MTESVISSVSSTDSDSTANSESMMSSMVSTSSDMTKLVFVSVFTVGSSKAVTEMYKIQHEPLELFKH